MARRFSSSSGRVGRRAWARGAAEVGHLRRVEASGGVGLLRWPAPPPSSSGGQGPGAHGVAVAAGRGRAGWRGGGRGAAGRAAAGREGGGARSSGRAKQRRRQPFCGRGGLWLILRLGPLPRAQIQGPRQRFFIFFKYSLPRAIGQALDKDPLCRGPS